MWQSGDWKNGNTVPILKKGRKKDPGNYQLVSPIISVPRNIMEQTFLEALLRHREDRGVFETASMAIARKSAA